MNSTVLYSYYQDNFYREQFLEALLLKEIISKFSIATGSAYGLENIELMHPIELDVSKIYKDNNFQDTVVHQILDLIQTI